MRPIPLVLLPQLAIDRVEELRNRVGQPLLDRLRAVGPDAHTRIWTEVEPQLQQTGGDEAFLSLLGKQRGGPLLLSELLDHPEAEVHARHRSIERKSSMCAAGELDAERHEF